MTFGQSGVLPAAVCVGGCLGEEHDLYLYCRLASIVPVAKKKYRRKWKKRFMRLSFLLLLDKLTGKRMKWQRGKPDKTIRDD